MKKVLLKIFLVCMLCLGLAYTRGRYVTNEKDAARVWASGLIEQDQLYAKAAVLMDGESGRILLGKNEDVQLPMASTTKIMTCILVLEHADVNETVKVSSYAAGMPAVKLNIRKGESYKVSDLLYSLMLESHNDTAVVLAEHVGAGLLGSGEIAEAPEERAAEESKLAVAAFANLMNEKAKELGCNNTWYITPNGLDATQQWEENGETVTKTHSTTAYELARVMKYCTWESDRKTEFLEITGRGNYSFTANGRSFCLSNHNQFLNMMDGAVSGKTGFTGNAGYCYVGALEKGERKLIVALLACGWPNNKNYKWSDTRKLMEYGLGNFTYLRTDDDVFMYEGDELSEVYIKNGVSDDWAYGTYVTPERKEGLTPEYEGILIKPEESIRVETDLIGELEAPVRQGKKVGEIRYFLGEELIKTESVVINQDIDCIDYKWCLARITELFCGMNSNLN